MKQPWFERVLSRQEVLWFFLAASFIYIFPLVLADLFYNDDSWRMLVAAGNWGDDGRPVITLFHQLMSFGWQTPDLFPLPLFVATAGIAVALRALTFFYFKQPTFTCCLVVLPIWYNPFFLQNLSYRYDGPAMALAMAALVYAMTYRSEKTWRSLWVPAVFIALALATYQLLLCFFIALCCVEVIRLSTQHRSSPLIFSFVARAALQVAIGLLIYYATAYQWMNNSRQGLVTLDDSGWQEVVSRWLLLVHELAGMLNEGTRLLAGAGLVLATIGYLVGAVLILRRLESGGRNAALLVLYLMAVVVLLLCVPGVAVFFSQYVSSARMLISVGALLVLLMFLSHWLLARIHRRLELLLVIPVLAMLSFSYGYGRVLSLQKQQEDSVMTMLAYDVSHSPLREVNSLYLKPDLLANWLPAACGLFTAMPAYRYIFESGYTVLPEMLPRVGIVNVHVVKDPAVFVAIDRGDYRPVGGSSFYDLYLINGSGYIVMKRPPDTRSSPSVCWQF